MKKLALGLLIAVATIAVFVALKSEAESPMPDNQAHATTAVVSLPVVSGSGIFNQPKVSGSSTSTPAMAGQFESLSGKLRDAQSYRQFVLAAAQQPERGGIAYSQSVGTTCAVIQKSLTTPRTNQPGAPATAVNLAVAVLKSRCDITREELDSLRKSQAFVEGSKKDPLVSLRRALDSVRPEDRAMLVGKVLESADPIVLDAAILSSRKGSANADLPEVFIDGQWRTAQEAEAIGVDNAFTLAKCDLGWDCGPNNPMTLAECALAGVCHDSLEKTLMAVKMPSQDWAKTLKLKHQIVEAVRAKNVGFFVASK